MALVFFGGAMVLCTKSKYNNNKSLLQCKETVLVVILQSVSEELRHTWLCLYWQLPQTHDDMLPAVWKG